MTPDEAIDFLVDRVGHERANATAGVRRSPNRSYLLGDPLPADYRTGWRFADGI
jgi:hypothetical protein